MQLPASQPRLFFFFCISCSLPLWVTLNLISTFKKNISIRRTVRKRNEKGTEKLPWVFYWKMEASSVSPYVWHHCIGTNRILRINAQTTKTMWHPFPISTVFKAQISNPLTLITVRTPLSGHVLWMNKDKNTVKVKHKYALWVTDQRKESLLC